GSVDSLQMLAVAPGILDVVRRAVLHLGDLFRAQLAHDLRRGADDQRAIGKTFALRHHATRANDAVAADPGPVEHYRTNADQGTVADRAAVKHHEVTDGNVLADRERNA